MTGVETDTNLQKLPVSYYAYLRDSELYPLFKRPYFAQLW